LLDAGFKTCAGRPASLHYETKDANTYAAWKVDYLKYDNCYTDGTVPEIRFPPMGDALNASGRPIFYSLCGKFWRKKQERKIQILILIEQGTDLVSLWAGKVGNSWRTTHDIRDEWQSMINNIDYVIR